ncbi:MAG: biotin/lipoyl-binding protein [Solidesulfovibrio sp.]
MKNFPALRLWRRGVPQRPVIDRYILEFQADAVELEKQPTPVGIRSLYKLLCLLFCALILWSILGKIDMIVSAKGRLISTGKQILIQPLINSIIKKFHVEVGQIVKAGQTLVSLDPTFAVADESELKVRIGSLAVLIERLESELAEKPFPVTPDMPATKPSCSIASTKGARMNTRRGSKRMTASCSKTWAKSTPTNDSSRACAGSSTSTEKCCRCARRSSRTARTRA